MRGETTHISPDVGGVTPDDSVGEQGREAHTKNTEPYVFVLDKNHTPLQPCHPARARKLLAKGRAVVPQGKKAGVHTGRVAVRASGSFNITTAQGTVQGIGHKRVRVLQRADGYGYTWKGEGVSSRTCWTGFPRPTKR